MGRRWLSSFLSLLLACSYILPASWRSFRADPDDAAPSITRALASRQLGVAKWDPTSREIMSDYLFTSDGVDRLRERYIIRWERSDDGTVTIFVRHELQARGSDQGRPVWEATTHDAGKELQLLDAITAELERLRKPLPPAAS